MPIFDPRWVKNGDAVSISFSITWQTEETQRLVQLSYVNAVLRRFGWPQKAAGANETWDWVKIAAYRALRPVYDAVKKLVGDRRKALAIFLGRKATEAAV